MSDFSRPEYASYIALCRELKLPVRLSEDGYPTPGHAQILNEYGQVVSIDYQNEHGVSQPSEWICWLPTLSDWLEMLEEAGLPIIEFSPYPHAGFQWMARYSRYPITDEGNFRQDAGPTREEAAARLWMAVSAPVQDLPLT